MAPEDAEKLIAYATAENLEAYQVAVVTESPRMVMHWNGQKIADLSRAFLNTNGASKHTRIVVPDLPGRSEKARVEDVAAGFYAIARNPNLSSQRGLGERFDSTIGAGSVISPFGGKYQLTPAQTMVGLLPVGPGNGKPLVKECLGEGAHAHAADADKMRHVSHCNVSSPATRHRCQVSSARPWHLLRPFQTAPWHLLQHRR